jgi:hypothetical protein
MGKTNQVKCPMCGAPMSLNRTGICKRCRVRKCSRCHRDYTLKEIGQTVCGPCRHDRKDGFQVRETMFASSAVLG